MSDLSILDKMEASHRKNPLAWAMPANDDVQAFWESDAKIRCLSGGNRAAKTESAVIDYLWTLTGTHPFVKGPPPPVAGRIEVTDHFQPMRTILPKFRKYCAPSMLVKGSMESSWKPKDHRFEFANGSSIDFVTHETPVENLQGPTYDIVWMDEEPPRSHYIENLMRTTDRDGKIVMTFTAVKGITWSLEEIVERSQKEPDLIFYRALDLRKNRFLPPSSIQSICRLITDPLDREIRIEGKVASRQGLCFRAFSEAQHVFHLPRPEWEWQNGFPPNALEIVAIDPGYDHPTGIVWLTLDPERGLLFVLGEYRQRHTIPKDHVEAIFQKNEELGFSDPVYVMDSQANARDASGTTLKESYIAAGLDGVVSGTKRLLEGNQFLELLFQNDRLFLHEDCTQLIDEIRHYRTRMIEGKTAFPTKRDDLIAALRYGAWHARPDILMADEDDDEPLRGERVTRRRRSPRTGY